MWSLSLPVGIMGALTPTAPAGRGSPAHWMATVALGICPICWSNQAHDQERSLLSFLVEPFLDGESVELDQFVNNVEAADLQVVF